MSRQATLGVYKNELRALIELCYSLLKANQKQLVPRYELEGIPDLFSGIVDAFPIPTFSQACEGQSPFRLASSLALSSIAMLSINTVSFALPTGYQSIAGNAQFNLSGKSLNVRTTASRSIVNYQSFNIGQDESISFNLPNRQAAILNRVIGGDPTEILGSMRSNGQVFLVNPSGILFSRSAQVNVGALAASTLDISDQNFLQGVYTFQQNSDRQPASVINQGNIQIQKNGYAVFTGASVQNSGTISAPQGQIQLAVGDKITVNIDENMAVEVVVDEALKQKVLGTREAISNTGTLTADGGSVILQAVLGKNLQQVAINNSGIVEAKGFAEHDGVVEFVATGDPGTRIQNTGTVDVSGTTSSPHGGTIVMQADTVENEGTLNASGFMGGYGGTVQLLGNKIGVLGQANINTSGDLGGGTILIGGDTQGSGLTPRAQTTFVGMDTVLQADALTQGNGGKVILWSDGKTTFNGHISAQGGVDSGDGGFVEVSGKQQLVYNGVVTTAASKGHLGTLLLDPTDIVIVNAGSETANLTDTDAFADPDIGGDGSTLLDVTAINGAISNVILQAEHDITFNAPVAMVNTGKTLTAQAKNNIYVNQSISTTNAAIQLLADSDGSGTGSLTVASGATISANGNITLQGQDVTVAGTVSNINSVTVIANTMALTGSIVTHQFQLTPYNSATTIGLGGGVGTLNLDVNELARITATGYNFGSVASTTGNITVGVVDYSGHQANMGLFTSGKVLDGSVGDTQANVTLLRDGNPNNGFLTIDGGNWTGSGGIGTAGDGDFDVLVDSVNAVTKNANIYLGSPGDLNIGAAILRSGTGNIYLSATHAINTVWSTPGVISTPGTLTMISGGPIGDNLVGGIQATTGAVTVTSAGGNNVTITQSGTFTVNNINTGGVGNVTLKGTDIIDTDIVEAGIPHVRTTGIVTLTTTSGGVGTLSNPFNVYAGNNFNNMVLSVASGLIYTQDTPLPVAAVNSPNPLPVATEVGISIDINQTLQQVSPYMSVDNRNHNYLDYKTNLLLEHSIIENQKPRTSLIIDETSSSRTKLDEIPKLLGFHESPPSQK